MKDSTDIVRERIQNTSEGHRLKRNVVDIREGDVWDVVVGLSHFGRADLGDLHEICTDWEVYDEPIDGAVVTLGVDVEGMVPIGSTPD